MDHRREPSTGPIDITPYPAFSGFLDPSFSRAASKRIVICLSLLPALQSIDRIRMDAGQYIREAAAYTRATLVGKWSRWLIIVLLGLPWLVLRSLVESSKIIQGTTIHWNLIPWDEAGLLIITGLLCNFFLLGYFVRLMKGDRAPPEFVNRLLL